MIAPTRLNDSLHCPDLDVKRRVVEHHVPLLVIMAAGMRNGGHRFMENGKEEWYRAQSDITVEDLVAAGVVGMYEGLMQLGDDAVNLGGYALRAMQQADAQEIPREVVMNPIELRKLERLRRDPFHPTPNYLEEHPSSSLPESYFERH